LIRTIIPFALIAFIKGDSDFRPKKPEYANSPAYRLFRLQVQLLDPVYPSTVFSTQRRKERGDYYCSNTTDSFLRPLRLGAFALRKADSGFHREYRTLPLG
jgi:hypothetical protein